MSNMASPDGSEDVNDFLQRIKELGDKRDKEDEEDAYWAQRVSYCKFTLRKRFQWLTRKSEAQQLFETLSRVQTRRIARQVGGIAVMMHENGNALFEAEDRIARIDDRMSRFVGVRRVE